jgi:hypothetical protein
MLPGLGIGLYIAAKIVQRLDGRLWVKSTKGMGSMFLVSLPLEHSHRHGKGIHDLPLNLFMRRMKKKIQPAVVAEIVPTLLLGPARADAGITPVTSP